MLVKCVWVPRPNQDLLIQGILVHPGMTSVKGQKGHEGLSVTQGEADRAGIVQPGKSWWVGEEVIHVSKYLMEGVGSRQDKDRLFSVLPCAGRGNGHTLELQQNPLK